MQQDLKPCSSGVNRRSLVAGALGAIALPSGVLAVSLQRRWGKGLDDGTEVSRMVPVPAFLGKTEPDDDEIAGGHDGDDLLVVAKKIIGILGHWRDTQIR